MMRTALAASVALNLLVLGLGVGAVFHNGAPERDAVARDLGFGTFSEALRIEDRHALRKLLMQKSPQIRAAMGQRSTDMTALLAALRAEPFDIAALNAAMDEMQLRLEGQLALGHKAMGEVLAVMPAQERLKFADRLERGMRRGKGGKGHKGE
jgi:uncharacterized membrane protein